MAIIGPAYTKTLSGAITNADWSLTAFGFTAKDVLTADRLYLTVNTGAVRIGWDHGYTNPVGPTTLAGLRIPNNNFPIFILQGRSNIQSFQAVRDAGLDANVTITLESD